jgi:DNA-binding HxlR family transcriptional regulator
LRLAFARATRHNKVPASQIFKTGTACERHDRATMLRAHDPQRCPADQALELIGGKWKPMLLWRLSSSPQRHSQLRRALPGVSQRMLTLHLREMERDGLITRTVFEQMPPHVEYALTPAARRMLPLLEAFGAWWLDAHAQLSAAPTQAAADAATNVRMFRIRR